LNADSEPLWLSRALRPFTEVRPGEAVTVLLLTANVFLLLTAYYVIKPVREALILALESGAEYKAYMSGVIAVALVVLVPLYAKLVDRLPRIKLVIAVTLAFAAQLCLFFAAMGVESLRSQLGLVFYAWVGVFNMMLVAQFWAYANDLYDEDQGARLFPMIALGASVGAAGGSQVSASLIPLFGLPTMLLVATLLLVACAALFWLVERRLELPAVPAEAPDREPQKTAEPPKTTGSGAFQLVVSNRYLVMIALFALIFSWVNTNGEYMLGKLVKADALEAVQRGEIATADVGKHIGATYGEFFFYVNVLGVLLQSFVVSRLVKWLGLSKAFLLMPLLALGNAAAVAVVPLLSVLRVGKIAENASDYSLNNTLRQMLWLVTSTEVKYKAKQAVDTFFVRAGDVCSALSVWVFAAVLVVPLQRFALISIGLCLAWLVLAVAIGRAFRKRLATPLEAAAQQ
jgi:ATP:ADP antiporter, AAA family